MVVFSIRSDGISFGASDVGSSGHLLCIVSTKKPTRNADRGFGNGSLQFRYFFDSEKVFFIKFSIEIDVFKGRGSGSFGGGFLISSFGTREAFRYMGLIACLGGICYGLLHYFWLRKIGNDVEEDDDMDDIGNNLVIQIFVLTI